jgi:thiol-disulfide isomerase/thioredoxin
MQFQPPHESRQESKRVLLGRRNVLSGGLALALGACSKNSNEQNSKLQASAIVVPVDLYLQNVLAGAFTLAQLGGKAILLEFWATSCAICIAEMPIIAVLSERYESKGLRTVALSMPYDRPDLVLHFAKERRLPFPLAVDPAGHLLKDIATQAAQHREAALEGTPTRLLLKRTGQVVYREQGGLHNEGKTLDREIAKLL